MNLEIKRLTSDDWRVWRDVRLRALADAPQAFGAQLDDWSGDQDREERWRRRLEEVPANFVAYVGAKPTGQASGVLTSWPDRAALISMWVAPETRGIGVGDALIEAVEAWAVELGAASLVLSVKVDNNRAASLYQRHSFKQTHTTVQDGEFEMAKPLR